jgi:hypothetical protein
MSENISEEQPQLPPVKVAFVLDDVVVDVLHTDEKLSNIFLNGATAYNVTGEDGNQTAWIGDKYDAETETFTRDGVTPTIDGVVDQSMNPVKIAFVINGEVVDILHTDERLAAIFLSDPIVINVTGPDGNQTAQYGDIYDPETKGFTTPTEAERPPEQINFEGWIYDEELGHDVPPLPYPEDGKLYLWDNETISWIEDK